MTTRVAIFNREEFEAEVLRDVQGMYGETNPYTIFSIASTKAGGDEMTSMAAPWEFTTLGAKLACAKYLEKLANRAFAWLCALKDANGDWLESDVIDAYLEAKAKETGCHVDLNRGQYAMLLRLRKVEKTRELIAWELLEQMAGAEDAGSIGYIGKEK